MESLGTPTHKHKEALELDTVLTLVPQDPVTDGDMLVKPSHYYNQQYIKHLGLHIKHNSLNRKTPGTMTHKLDFDASLAFSKKKGDKHKH